MDGSAARGRRRAPVAARVGSGRPAAGGTVTAGTLLTPTLAAEAAGALTGSGAAERIGRREHFDLHECGAVADHVELGGRRIGQIDDAVGDERAAIVDAHDHAAAVGEIGDARVAGQRQRLVRGGHREHVIRFAGRGAQAVKLRAVPGGDAALDVAGGAGEYHVAVAGDFVEGRIAERAARLQRVVPRRARSTDVGRRTRRHGRRRRVRGRRRRGAAHAAAAARSQQGQRPVSAGGAAARPQSARLLRDLLLDRLGEIVDRHRVQRAAVVARDARRSSGSRRDSPSRPARGAASSSAGVSSGSWARDRQARARRPPSVSLSASRSGGRQAGAGRRAGLRPAPERRTASRTGAGSWRAGEDVAPVVPQIASRVRARSLTANWR